MKDKGISVIIVTYNSADYISNLLSSISKFIDGSYEIIVVDNHSQDKTLQVLKKYPQVKLFAQSENLGFSKANNIGATSATYPTLLFLNPDTELLGPIDNLVKDLESEKVGIAAPQLIFNNGSIQPSVRKFPTIWGAVKEYIWRIPNSYEAYVPQVRAPVRVETVVGGAFAIKKTVFEKIGGFDARYFLYFEDLELCRQIKKFGLGVLYDPTVKMRHQHGRSSKTNPKSSQYLIESSQIYHGSIKAHLLYLVMRLAQLINK